MSPTRSPARLLLAVALAAGVISGSSGAASAAPCSDNTFACLHPEFQSTEIVPAYADPEAAISPATFDEARGDFRANFASPSGRRVSIVVKAPVTTQVYDVPQIRAGQSTYEYLNSALVDSAGNPRNSTTINLPTATYNVDFALHSNCTDPLTGQPQYTHWIFAGSSDVVIDGHGSTVNFSDFCLGMYVANVNRVVLKNFTFAWPHIQIAQVASVLAVGGNGNTGYTYDVHLDPIPQPLPAMLAAATAWDRAADHWDLMSPNDDVSYGDGVTSGAPIQCAEPPAQRASLGCTVHNIPSYGTQFKVGESLLLRFYSFGTALSLSGNDITLENVTVKNLIGSDFSYNVGRGLHVDHLTMTRMPGQPVSATGGGSLITNTGGDIVLENSTIEYQSDDALDLNTTISRYLNGPVNNSTPMNTFTFNPAKSSALPWPAFNIAAVGDVIGLFGPELGYKGSARVIATNYAPDGSSAQLTLDHDIPAALVNAGFIAGDLSTSAGARYLIRNNQFRFNRARALLLQTPYGLVQGNQFVGQTLKQVYMLASQYWGEGAGAQEIVLANNNFDARAHSYQSGFFALDLLGEAANFPNLQNEVYGTNVATPAINQNIVVRNNTFTIDQPVALINVSSANDVLFYADTIDLVAANSPASAGVRQYPVSVHDASNVYFDSVVSYSTSMTNLTCAGSIMYQLSSPPLPVVARPPYACVVPATTSSIGSNIN